MAAASAAMAIDPYDLADPEDFLGKMPKDFFDKIVSFQSALCVFCMLRLI